MTHTVVSSVVSNFLPQSYDNQIKCITMPYDPFIKQKMKSSIIYTILIPNNSFIQNYSSKKNLIWSHT